MKYSIYHVYNEKSEVVLKSLPVYGALKKNSYETFFLSSFQNKKETKNMQEICEQYQYISTTGKIGSIWIVVAREENEKQADKPIVAREATTNQSSQCVASQSACL